MVSPSHLKHFHSLHIFSTKPPSLSTFTSIKLKTLIHTIILPQLCRLARALSNAKSILVQLLKEIQLSHFKGKKKLFLGSFRLHYNWSSSHVPSNTANHAYYDPTWSSFIGSEGGDVAETRLSRYLHWLEEENHEDCSDGDGDDVNEIDRLADMFIDKCHEKFRLEKQESYRRFQEMMARSI